MSQIPLPPLAGVNQFFPSRPNPVVSDGYAWLLCFMPLLGWMAEAVLTANGYRNPILFNAGYWGIAISVCSNDRRELRHGGYRPPSGWWLLLWPTYLWRRATVLGRSRAMFWMNLGTLVVPAIAVVGLVVLIAASPQLLACDEVSPAQVTSMFNRIDEVKQAGIQGVSLGDVRQISANAEQRVCAATITSVDGRRWRVTFQDRLEDGANMLNVWAR